MSGRINVAVRFESGETICQPRGTMAISPWLRDMRLVGKDESLLREFLHDAPEWSEPTPVAPYDYGLVVIDMAQGRIFERNDYSRIDRLMSGTWTLAKMDRADKERLKAFADDGRVSVLRAWAMDDTIVRHPEAGMVVDWETMRTTLRKDWAGKHGRHVRYQFDLSPLEYTNYSGRSEGVRAMRGDLMAAGFDVSSALWNEHLVDDEEAA